MYFNMQMQYLNGAVSNLGSTALDERMRVRNELKYMWEATVMVQFF